MTNSQESDSITEKPKVAKTGPKSTRWNWKTATVAVAAANASSCLLAKLYSLRQRLNRWNWRQSATAVQACAASGDLIADFLLIGLPIKTQIEPVEEEIEYSEVY